MPRENFRITAEIRSIQNRAAEHDGRIVSLGPLLLFATDTGDAWILDHADHLASRLARDGEPLDVYVEDSEVKYAIAWKGRYRFEADLFVYEDNDSLRETAIRGYPIQRLLRMIEKSAHH